MAQALEKIFLQKVAQMPQEEVELLPPAPKVKAAHKPGGPISAGNSILSQLGGTCALRKSCLRGNGCHLQKFASCVFLSGSQAEAEPTDSPPSTYPSSPPPVCQTPVIAATPVPTIISVIPVQAVSPAASMMAVVPTAQPVIKVSPESLSGIGNSVGCEYVGLSKCDVISVCENVYRALQSIHPLWRFPFFVALQPVI